jgi:hypothetical protein
MQAKKKNVRKMTLGIGIFASSGGMRHLDVRGLNGLFDLNPLRAERRDCTDRK